MLKKIYTIALLSLLTSFTVQGQGYTFDRAVIAENVQLFSPYGYINEKYNFVEGQQIAVWIQNLNITRQYQVIFEWYSPDGQLRSSFRTATFGPYGIPSTDIRSNIFTPSTCQNGLWTVKYNIKDIVTDQITTITTKNFTLTCNCVPPSAPTTSGMNICSGTSANLTASGCSGGTITWWNSASGDNKVGTGSTFQTPQLTNTTTYYAQCELGTCISTTRTVATATVQQCSTSNSCRTNDSLELIKLYNATGGANWTRRTNWLSSNPINTWYGVTLNANGCVECIDLDGTNDCFFQSNLGNNLVGTLPNLAMSELKTLILSLNKLTGAIPNFAMPKLENLLLAGNKLSGSIPNFIMPNLRHVSMEDNLLSGVIPSLNAPNMVRINLAFNRLSGSIPNFAMPLLEQLYVDRNQLTGTIPTFNMPKLEWFYAYSNQLSGNIPTFNTSILKYLIINNNQLSGTIPNFNMPNLQYLYLHNNQLSGTIPNFNIQALKYLYLHNNQLIGTIPNFNMPNLESCHLYENRLNNSPQLTNLGSLKKDSTHQDNSPLLRGLRSYSNKLTFDDIIPNMGFATSATFVYTPQDSIFKDTTYQITIGSSLTIDLEIDGGIPDNSYKWFKNGSLYLTTRTNKLPLTNLQQTDVGVYTCEVTNFRAPALTLYSRKITVQIPCNLVANQPSAINKCGTNAQVLDLTTRNSVILGSQNGTVNWYTDANATQLISNPGSFLSTGRTVYARIISPQGCQSNIIAMPIQVTNQAASAGIAGTPLVLCLGSNNASIQLSNLLTGVVGDIRVWQSITPLGNNFDAVAGVLNPTGLAVNTYQFKYVVSNDCGRDSTIVTVRIAPKPTANAIDTVRRCGSNLFDLTQSDAAILGNQSGSRVSWFRDANGINAILRPTAFDIALSSTVYAQVINTDNCTSQILTVRLKLTPTPNTGSARPQHKLCYRASGLTTIRLDSLISNGQTGGVWSLTSDSQNPNAAFNTANGILNPNGLSAGLYRFKYFISNACGQAETVVEVNIGNQPTANAGVNESINCQKTQIILRGSPEIANNRFEWKSPTRTVQNISMTTQEGGTHTFTVTDLTSGCKASSSIFITMDTARPMITSITTTPTKCANTAEGAITLSATGNSTILPLSYKLNSGSFGNQPVFNGLAMGNYTVIVQGKNLCQTSTNTNVAGAPAFTEQIKFPECYYYVGTEVRLSLQEQGGIRTATTPIRYVWSVNPSVEMSCVDCANPKFKIKDTTALKVTVRATDNKGCIATNSIVFDKIRENKPPDIITPNGDGLNDFLVFPDLDCGANTTLFLNNEITIINRWGDVVFTMKNYDNSWNGTNQNGQPLPEGTYFYILRLSLGDGKIYRNNVLLVR